MQLTEEQKQTLQRTTLLDGQHLRNTGKMKNGDTKKKPLPFDGKQLMGN